MENFLVDTRQAGKQTSGFQLSSLRQALFSLLGSFFSEICCTFHIWQMFIRLLTITLNFYYNFGSRIFMYHGMTFRQHVSFSISQQLVLVTNKLLQCFMQTSQLNHLVCLVCQETMAFKNFIFRENWVGKEVAGIKIAFFLPFLNQPGPTFWPQKATIWNSLNRISMFNAQKGRSYIIINYVT